MGDLKIGYAPYKDILTDQGPMSFGLVLSVDVVSWSAPGAKDLLVSRCWEGVFLYPSMDLESFGDPIKLCDPFEHSCLAVEPADWNDDGIDEVIGADRNGYIFLLRKTGVFPDLRLESLPDPAGVREWPTDKGPRVFPNQFLMPMQGPRLSRAEVPFNIPFDNPYHELISQVGYINPEYFNYIYPTAYSSRNLIVGDWGGSLWWLPRAGIRDGIPQYEGENYTKSDGLEFAKPRFKVLDENGSPFLLGEGVESGGSYPGGVARPVLFHNNLTGTDDLLVLCGTVKNELRYLRRLESRHEGAPTFRDLGPVAVEEYPGKIYEPFCYHSTLAVIERDGWSDLLISTGGQIGVYRNKRLDAEKPEFVFSHWISGCNVPTQGFNYTEILKGPEGKRYILDNDNIWFFREVLVKDGGVRLSSTRHELRDQHGIFSVEGETDHVHIANWGFHRAALWDYDGSGKQHLIVGTDKGLLYLLREEEPLGSQGKFEFRSFGPLKDSNGDVIKVHNRAVAAPIDLDGDGRFDLVLGGASYQLGIDADPNPGGGVYYSTNRGLGPDGLPVLDPIRPIDMIGLTLDFHINQHVQLQSLDLLGNGERLLIVATQENSFQPVYVFRPSRGRIAIEYTGITLPILSIEERLLDLDGDGKWEYLRSGGEMLIGSYAKCEFDNF